MTAIRNMKKGDFFTLKKIEYPTDRQVWVRGDYDRSLKAYEYYRFDDVNEIRYISGKTLVYTEFIF